MDSIIIIIIIIIIKMRLYSVYYISVDSSTCFGCLDTHQKELVQL